MYKILITGGSGFIGTNILLSLQKEYELLNIDIRQPQLPDIRKCTLLVDIIDYPLAELKR